VYLISDFTDPNGQMFTECNLERSTPLYDFQGHIWRYQKLSEHSPHELLMLSEDQAAKEERLVLLRELSSFNTSLLLHYLKLEKNTLPVQPITDKKSRGFNYLDYKIPVGEVPLIHLTTIFDVGNFEDHQQVDAFMTAFGHINKVNQSFSKGAK
jgi:hypothetical protein